MQPIEFIWNAKIVAFLGGHLEGLGQNGFGTPEGKIDWVV
jgi:hypothetical protein